MKLFHGDCLEAIKDIPNKSIDMVLTDIPYGEVSKNGEERAKYAGQLRNIDKGNADLVNFNLGDLLNSLSRVAKGGIYIFCGIEQLAEIYTHFSNHKDFMVRQCAWRKTNPSPANGQHLWLSSFENCVFAKRRKTKFNQSCKSSVWDYPVGKSKLVPTEKPLKLFEYLMESSSDEGDVVLDPFMGSGTTGVACKNLNRDFIGIELDENYFNIAKQRIEEA